MDDERASAASPKWFPALRRRTGARWQLFCLPFAGGGASAYRSWQALLPPEIDLWPLEYPGHETRFNEPAIDNARDLAASIAEQIVAAADRPFALFGHSMGALLAFETAVILRRSYGLQPVMLFVSGLGAPHLKPFRRPIRDLPEVTFRDELRVYGGIPEEILSDDDFMNFLSPLLRRDLGICETYVHAESAPLSVPIVAFGGNDDPTVPWDRMLRWSEMTTADFRVHFMPGAHFFIREAARLVCDGIAHSLEGSVEDDGLAPPGPREVHLWTVPVATTASQEPGLRALLSAEERAAADAFARPADRARYVTTRAALRTLLGRYSRQRPDEIRLSQETSGKPRCEALLPLEFNVSHSGEMALIAFTSGCSVGVDVEHIRCDFDFAGVGRQVFTPAELKQLSDAGTERSTTAFFDLWVRKEAFFKCSGEGFGGALETTHLGLGACFAPGRQTVDSAAAPGTLLSFRLAPDYAGAVAAERAIDQTIVRQWQGGLIA
jgi:medium-chain acyl-[acyl-carrier-protein] hydrolase